MNPFEVGEKIKQLATGFEELSKSAPEVRTAMRHLQKLVRQGAMPPQHFDTIRRQMFTDHLTGGKVGNMAAYDDFNEGIKSNNPGGIHIRLDANDFGSINKVHGKEMGDVAIKDLFHTIRGAVDDSVGHTNAKVFRIGGDEAHIHVPNHEAGAHFARTLFSRLNSLAPIGGTHRLSVSLGFGSDPEQAENALIRAKKAKKAQNYPTGQSDHHAWSLVPGREGEIPRALPNVA